MNITCNAVIIYLANNWFGGMMQLECYLANNWFGGMMQLECLYRRVSSDLFNYINGSKADIK